MILSQLRRDFAVRSLSWWLPIAVLMGGFIWWRGSNLPSAPGDIYKAIFFVWVALAIFFLNSRYASRCSSGIEITWPVTTRRLWLTHVLAIVFSGLTLLVAIVATVGAGNALSGARPLVHADLTSLAVSLGVGMILALAVLQSPKISLYEIPVRTPYVMLTIVSVAGVAGLAIVLIDRPLAWALAPLAVALALGIRTYRSLPKTLKLAPRVSDRHGAAAGAGWQDSAIRDLGRAAFAWRLFSTIWCSPRGRWTWWYLPILALHGVALALSMTWSGRGDWDKIQLPYVAFAWVILASWLMVSISRLWSIDPLPISRRRVFAALTVPALLSVVVGYGLGWAATARSMPRGPQIVDAKGSSQSLIKIPGEFWEIAWDGEVPAVVTPWGESLRPCCAIPVINGRRTGLYHPYYTPRGSSPDVVAFQLSRALAGGYGVEIPYPQVRERYLEVDTDGAIQLRDHPRLTARGRGSSFPVVFALIGVPWLLFAAFTYRVHRAGASAYARLSVGIVFGVGFALGIGALALDAVDVVNLEIVSRLVGILIRRMVESLPGGVVTLWIVGLALVAGSYLLAQAQFRRFEATVQRSTN